jgi:uncharacterized membrane protein
MSPLLEYSDQFRAPIWMVVVRLAVVLAIAWIAGPMLARTRWGTAILLSKKETPASLIGIVAILAWFVLFSVGMLRHLTFHSKAWDLAIFDQVIWNLANGNGWQCSVRGVQDLRGDHFEPILLIFVPIYRLMPHVGWLLGAQAAALVGAGVILWATYRRKIGDSAAFMLFLAYLFFPPIHWLSIADFHPIALAPLFVMIAWWGRERGRVGAFIAGLIGLGLCGEEGFIVAGWWGFWEFLVSGISRATRRPAIGWTGLAAMVFFWAGFVYLSAVYIPAHRVEGAGYFYVHRYAYLGHNLPDIVRNFFTRPGLWIGHLVDSRSLALLALYLVPLALLPLVRPKILALLIPTVIYTLLSESPEQKSIFHQYTAMWIPFLVIAASEALGGMGTGIRSLPPDDDHHSPDQSPGRQGSVPVPFFPVFPLLIASFLAFLAFSPTFGLSMHPELFQPEPWAGEAKGIVASIGPDQAISAPSALCPHLSHRRVLLLKPNNKWPGTGEILMLPDFPPDGSR